MLTNEIGKILSKQGWVSITEITVILLKSCLNNTAFSFVICRVIFLTISLFSGLLTFFHAKTLCCFGSVIFDSRLLLTISSHKFLMFESLQFTCFLLIDSLLMIDSLSKLSDWYAKIEILLGHHLSILETSFYNTHIFTVIRNSKGILIIIFLTFS